MKRGREAWQPSAKPQPPDWHRKRGESGTPCLPQSKTPLVFQSTHFPSLCLAPLYLWWKIATAETCFSIITGFGGHDCCQLLPQGAALIPRHCCVLSWSVSSLSFLSIFTFRFSLLGLLSVISVLSLSDKWVLNLFFSCSCYSLLKSTRATVSL